MERDSWLPLKMVILSLYLSKMEGTWSWGRASSRWFRLSNSLCRHNLRGRDSSSREWGLRSWRVQSGRKIVRGHHHRCKRGLWQGRRWVIRWRFIWVNDVLLGFFADHFYLLLVQDLALFWTLNVFVQGAHLLDGESVHLMWFEIKFTIQ